MDYFADLHIHSCYSRATSKFSTLPYLAGWARIKGIHLVGTGDFTHPHWFSHLQSSLDSSDSGFHRLKQTLLPPELADYQPREIDVRFVLTAEISCIYKRHGSVRKVHHLLVVPDFDSARRISHRLSDIGNLSADGRPILGLDSRNLLEIMLEEAPAGFLVPAHIWTPWFSLFGARSGFDTIEGCFGDLSREIFALETGLSADPEMIRRISALDRFTLISNSDAHSPQKLGREANLFQTGFDFDSLKAALRFPERGGYGGTIEFFPEEGKYFLDGHRRCNCSLKPSTTAELKGICPICQKPVTAGVLSRINGLADRPRAMYTETDPGFQCLLPLAEILAELAGVKSITPRVRNGYREVINRFGSELALLKDVPLTEIARQYSEPLSEALRRLRSGKVIRQPGFDGQYGVIRLFSEAEVKKHLRAGPTKLEKEISMLTRD
ncbi:endonuclease Q family protein [bacterium]|nr:endonuclease Q family protein [bacterium]